MGLLVLEQHIAQTYTKYQSLKIKRQSVEQEIGLWQQIMTKYTDYPDGYFHLATLEYELGNNRMAKVYLNKTLKLNPNYPVAADLSPLD